jgi:hypothetical protein
MKLPENKLPAARPRPFHFDRDRFAFANELLWEYQVDPATGQTRFRPRAPKPAFALRCFVLTRAARQFLYHARFAPEAPSVDDATCRKLIRQIVARNPRTPCDPDRQIVIPGYASLHAFSANREALLKSECGAAWQSYVLRSHWRMVLPIPRGHQARTATGLVEALAQSRSPIIHLVKFPSLTINHGMILFAVTSTAEGFTFSAYDPNQPQAPTELTFNHQTQTFSLPANAYWAGGPLKVIEIFRTWWM